MLVTSGSPVCAESRPEVSKTILRRRSRIVLEGVAEIVGDRLVLQQDYIFVGPGLAPDLMYGGHVRDPLKLWIDANRTSMYEHKNCE